MLTANWRTPHKPITEPTDDAPSHHDLTGFRLSDLKGFSCEFKDTRKRNSLKRAYEELAGHYAGKQGENVPLTWFSTVTPSELLQIYQVGPQTVNELQRQLRAYGIHLKGTLG